MIRSILIIKQTYHGITLMKAVEKYFSLGQKNSKATLDIVELLKKYGLKSKQFIENNEQIFLNMNGTLFSGTIDGDEHFSKKLTYILHVNGQKIMTTEWELLNGEDYFTPLYEPDIEDTLSIELELFFRVGSWNTNSFRGIGVEIFKEQKYSFLNRLDSIKKTLDYYLDKKRVPIFALQELEDSIMDDLEAYFHSKGMTTICNKYNPDKMSLVFLFAFDAKKYQLVKAEQIYLTVSGKPEDNSVENPSKEQIRVHNLDNDFARSAQKITLKTKAGKGFCIVNTHFALTDKHKFLAASRLCEALSEEQLPLIVLGDFNQFDKKKYNALLQEQIEVFTHNGYVWASENLNQQPGGTFLPYPYDIQYLFSPEAAQKYISLVKKFQESRTEEDRKEVHQFLLNEIQNLAKEGKTLHDVAYDAMFTARLPQHLVLNCKARFFANNEYVKNPSRDQINEYATRSYIQDEECPFPSDHLSLCGTVTLK